MVYKLMLFYHTTIRLYILSYVIEGSIHVYVNVISFLHNIQCEW